MVKIFLLSLVATGMQANNCTLGCNGTPSSPNNVAVDTNCEAVLTADMILEGPICPGLKILTVRDLSNNLIVMGPEPVTVTGAYLGQTLAVSVLDVDSGNQCTGYINLMDNLAPLAISCGNLTVFCNEPTDPASVGLPVFEDNCDANPILSYTESVLGPDCSILPPDIGYIVRTWTATDNFSNSSQCTQTITIQRLGFGDIAIPGPATLGCDNANTDPAVTGSPTVNGLPLITGGFCEFTVSYIDNIVYTCLPATHSYQIIRTWTLVNDCNNEIMSFQQIINVGDNSGPQITCPSGITFGTNPGMCEGSVALPIPQVSDNCSNAANISISVTTSYGGTGFGPHFNVPVGTHTVTYTAFDECGNSTSCQSTIMVLDNEAPIAICDEFTVIGIPSTGTAIVPGANLDDGSYDNCLPIVFSTSRDGGLSYQPFLTFDCDDVGQAIDVILRVEEQGNPSAYNECFVVVNVMDNIPPQLLCPSDVTVDCHTDYPPLDTYGSPTVLENCNYTLSVDSSFNISNCGEGTITRSWTVTDMTGNTASCTQTIFVENLTPFDGSTIQWPQDYILDNACVEADQLDPEDLPCGPVNYCEPYIPNEACALPALNYSDQLFYISYPACYKIVRTWSVMDWCSFDPENPGDGGIWTHVQIIKTNDYIEPTLTVPPDSCVGVDENCLFGTVDLPEAAASDCAPDVTISNDSPYAFSGGADASGLYPLGATVVRFTASDGCGNTSIDSLTVTVKDDTPPSLICNSGIVAELADVNGEIMTIVDGDLFVQHLDDNCSDPEDIEIFIQLADGNTSGPPSTTQLNFFCQDQGTHEIEVWVVDEAGNADYCITDVIIQDNFQLCPLMFTATIAGFLGSESGTSIEEVMVHISNNNGVPDQMSSNGYYSFLDLPAGGDYSISPEKNDFPSNGVTTYDMVLISRHILGVELLDSPYKLIAADVNRSGTISTVDMVEIRKIILNIEEGFPGNTSWRFVDEAYEFPDPNDPFQPEFPEVININNLPGNVMDANFIGIKTGDVNHSADPEGAEAMQERTVNESLPFVLGEAFLKQGEEYELAFLAADFREIAGYQYTLELDPEAINFHSLESCVLPNLGPENFGLTYLENGYLTTSWFDPRGLSLEDGECLFIIHVKATQSGRLSEFVQINSALTPAEAYHSDGTVLIPQLLFTEGPSEGLRLYQNRPNPFQNATILSFSLPEEGPASLRVYDLNGKEVFRYRETLDAGYHEIEFNRSVLPGPGMYYYLLETEKETDIKKMLLLE